MNEITEHNNKSCCICLEEESQSDIKDNNRLVEYNHCGIYYVHNKCLNTWNSNECLICRKNFNVNDNDNHSDNENHNLDNIITVLIDNDDRSLQYRRCCLNFCFLINIFGIVYYILINYN